MFLEKRLETFYILNDYEILRAAIRHIVRRLANQLFALVKTISPLYL